MGKLRQFHETYYIPSSSTVAVAWHDSRCNPGHIEPCLSSARHKPSAWHDEMTTVRIAGRSAQPVLEILRDSASTEGPDKSIRRINPLVPST